MSVPAIEYDRLTMDERLDLIEKVWDSLDAEASMIPLTPSSGTSWIVDSMT